MNQHEKSRSKLCLICWGYGKKPITQNIADTIRSYLIEGYVTSDVRFPSSLCTTCFTRLSEYQRGLFNRPLAPWYDCSGMARFRLQRHAISCECPICEKAEGVTKFGAKTSKRRVGRPKSSNNSSTKPSILMLCNMCLIPLSFDQLKSHVCKESNLVEAVVELKKTIPIKNQKRLSYEILKDELATGDAVKLNSGGRPIKIQKTIGNNVNDNSSALISHQDFDLIRIKNDLSVNKTIGLAHDLRSILGKNCFEPNLKKHIQTQNKKCEDLFETCRLNDKCMVYCSNVPELLKRVNAERGSGKPDLYRLGSDDGRTVLKLTLSIIAQSDSVSSSGDKKNNAQFRDSGVKRILILAAVLNGKEDYETIKAMFEKTRVIEALTDLPYCISSDLKMINIIIGIGAHSSTFPCAFCIWPIGENEELGPWLLRTFESIQKNSLRWKSETNSDPRELKNYFNCRHDPLILGTENIIDRVVPSPLHLLLGITQKIVHSIEGVYPRTTEWLNEINVSKQPQRGGQFTGNNCRKIQKSVDVLQRMMDEDGASDFAREHVELLQLQDKVIESCFGDKLLPDYAESIVEFRNKFQSMNISSRMTKFHILSSHVIPFIQKKGKGLSIFSESTLESSHHDFLHFWNRHRVTRQESDLCQKQFLKSILEYNACHMA